MGRRAVLFGIALFGLALAVRAPGQVAARLVDRPAQDPPPPLVFVDRAGLAADAPDALYVISEDGQGRRPIAERAPGQAKRAPVWSPDRRRVAFQTQLKDYPAAGQNPAVLASFELSSGRSALLTEGPTDEDPAWDPSADQLLFVSVLGPADNPAVSVLSQVSSTGGDARPAIEPLNGPGRRLAQPVPSPDGRFIALVVVNNGGAASEGELYLIERATGRWTRPLPHPGWDDRDPAWSPDSLSLAFAAAPLVPGRPPIHGIWRLDLATGAAGSLVLDPTNALHDLRRPSWSPDGRRMVFDLALPGDRARSLHLVDATGGLLKAPLTTGWDADWAGTGGMAAPTPSPTLALPTPTSGSPVPTQPGTTPTPPGEPTFPVLPTLQPLPTFPPSEPTLGPAEPTYPPPPTATTRPSMTPTASIPTVPVYTPSPTLSPPAPSPTPPMPAGESRVYLPIGYRLVDPSGAELTPTVEVVPTSEATPPLPGVPDEPS